MCYNRFISENNRNRLLKLFILTGVKNKSRYGSFCILKKLAEISAAPSFRVHWKGNPDISRATQERVRALAQGICTIKPSALALSLRNKRSSLDPYAGSLF